MTWQQRIDRALDERRAADALRRRLPVTHGAGRWLAREGERWLNFSSNDYLGLSQHPAIIAAWQQGAVRQMPSRCRAPERAASCLHSPARSAAVLVWRRPS